MIKPSELKSLTLPQLQKMLDSVDGFLCKENGFGEPFHPNYRKNKKSFTKLVTQTVALQRKVKSFMAKSKKNSNKLINFDKIKIVSAAEDDDWLDEDAWDEADIDLSGELTDGIYPIYDTGVEATTQELNIGNDISSNAAPSQKFLNDYIMKLASDINDTTKENIKEAIKTSLNLGEDRDALQNRLSDILDDDYRSQMIAQTESVRSYSEGRLAVGRDAGYGAKRWDGDQSGACEWCSELDGKVIDIDDEFESSNDNFDNVSGPPLHPNCACGLSLIKDLEDDSEGVEASERLFKSIYGGWVTMPNGAHILLPDGDDNRSNGTKDIQERIAKYGFTPLTVQSLSPESMHTIAEKQGWAAKHDFSKPGKPSGDIHQDMEHMIKYNSALQITHSIPNFSKDMIYKVDVSNAKNPLEMSKKILESLPKEYKDNSDVAHSLDNWGKSSQMVFDHAQRIKDTVTKAKEYGLANSIKAGWITMNGNHVFIPDDLDSPNEEVPFRDVFSTISPRPLGAVLERRNDKEIHTDVIDVLKNTPPEKGHSIIPYPTLSGTNKTEYTVNAGVGHSAFDFKEYENKPQIEVNKAVSTRFDKEFPELKGTMDDFNFKIANVKVGSLDRNVAADPLKVSQYVKDIKGGDKFPPLIAIRLSGGPPEIMDGAHRSEAVIKAGATSVDLLLGDPK